MGLLGHEVDQLMDLWCFELELWRFAYFTLQNVAKNSSGARGSPSAKPKWDKTLGLDCPTNEEIVI
jgi:hypothetical protein